MTNGVKNRVQGGVNCDYAYLDYTGQQTVCADNFVDSYDGTSMTALEGRDIQPAFTPEPYWPNSGFMSEALRTEIETRRIHISSEREILKTRCRTLLKGVAECLGADHRIIFKEDLVDTDPVCIKIAKEAMKACDAVSTHSIIEGDIIIPNFNKYKEDPIVIPKWSDDLRPNLLD